MSKYDSAKEVENFRGWSQAMIEAALNVSDNCGTKIHFLVMRNFPGVEVPDSVRLSGEVQILPPDDFQDLFPIKTETVILNLAARATSNRAVTVDSDGEVWVSFKARFAGKDHSVMFPAASIALIFYPDEYLPTITVPQGAAIDWAFFNTFHKFDANSPPTADATDIPDNPPDRPKVGRPNLRVVK